MGAVITWGGTDSDVISGAVEASPVGLNNPVVSYTFTPGTGTSTWLGTVTFTPALPSGTSVSVHFRGTKRSGG